MANGNIYTVAKSGGKYIVVTGGNQSQAAAQSVANQLNQCAKDQKYK